MRITLAEKQRLKKIARSGKYRDSQNPPWKTGNNLVDYDCVRIPARNCIPHLVLYLPHKDSRSNPNCFPFIQWVLGGDPMLRLTADWIPHLIRCLEVAQELVESEYLGIDKLRTNIPKDLAKLILEETKLRRTLEDMEKERAQLQAEEKALSENKAKVELLRKLPENKNHDGKTTRRVVMSEDDWL